MSATQTQRAAWQRRAACKLAAILHQHPHLPVIAWAITPTGGALTAHVIPGDPYHSEQTFTAWATALHLTQRRTPHPDGIITRLWAHGHLDGTRVNLNATTSNDY